MSQTQKNMKIAVFCIDYPTLNAGLSVCDALSSRGHDCTLILTPYTNNPGELKRRARASAHEYETIPFIMTAYALYRYRRMYPARSCQEPRERNGYIHNLVNNIKNSVNFGRIKRFFSSWTFFGSRKKEVPLPFPGVKAVREEILEMMPYVKDNYISRKRELNRAKNILKYNMFDAVIMTHDVEGSITTPFFKACKDLKIPVFLYPYTFPEPRAPFLYFKDNEDRKINTWLKKKYSDLFPKYKWSEEGCSLLYAPMPMLVASQICGMSLPRPWYTFSSDFDAIFLQNKYLYKKFMELEYDTNKLVITGAPEYDTIYRLRKDFHDNKRRDPFGVVKHADRQTVLINVGFNAFGKRETGNSPIFSSWTDYCKYYKCIIDVLTKKFNVVLSFHPRVTRWERKVFPKKGCVVADIPLLHILAFSDIVITYSGSSIIYHALSAGCKTIIFDSHGYNYKDYDDDKEIIMFSDRGEFEKYIYSISSSSGDDSVVSSVFEESPFDGKVAERIEKTIEGKLRRRVFSRKMR